MPETAWVDPRNFTVTFLILVAGVMMVGTLIYAFVRAVSYSTFQGLEQEWRYKYRRRESGREGEDAVAHELAFLPRTFRVAHRVYLRVKGRDAGQEFDHLVVGAAGVVHLETKNDLGKVVITPDGDWLIRREGKRYLGMKNPLAQVRRHGVILREFLEQNFPGRTIPVHGLIVLSRAETMLQGAQNCPVPIIKLERLHDYLIGLGTEKPLDRDTGDSIYRKFSERSIPEEDEMEI